MPKKEPKYNVGLDVKNGSMICREYTAEQLINKLRGTGILLNQVPVLVKLARSLVCGNKRVTSGREKDDAPRDESPGEHMIKEGSG